MSTHMLSSINWILFKFRNLIQITLEWNQMIVQTAIVQLIQKIEKCTKRS